MSPMEEGMTFSSDGMSLFAETLSPMGEGVSPMEEGSHMEGGMSPMDWRDVRGSPRLLDEGVLRELVGAVHGVVYDIYRRDGLPHGGSPADEELMAAYARRNAARG